MGKDAFSCLALFIFLLGVRNAFALLLSSHCVHVCSLLSCRIDGCCGISYVSNYVSVQPDWQLRKTRLGAKHAKNVGMCCE